MSEPRKEVVRILSSIDLEFDGVNDSLVDLIDQARGDRLNNTGGAEFYRQFKKLKTHLKRETFGRMPLSYYKTLGNRRQECNI